MDALKKLLRLLFVFSYLTIASAWFAFSCLPIFERSGLRFSEWRPKDLFDVLGSAVVVTILLGCASSYFVRHLLSAGKGPASPSFRKAYWTAFAALAALSILLTPVFNFTFNQILHALVGH